MGAQGAPSAWRGGGKGGKDRGSSDVLLELNVETYAGHSGRGSSMC